VIVGLGIDVCPVARIAGILERHGALFADRVFTPGELTHAGNGAVRNERLAARWAAKEAAIKALGAPEGLRWHDMEVVNDAGGAPSLRLDGAASASAEAKGVTRALLSLSHAAGVAVAIVVLEGGEHGSD
jgi:holo-[acyl-carrier protein] synthase